MLVVGFGGFGCAVLQYLVSVGVGNLMLFAGFICISTVKLGDRW